MSRIWATLCLTSCYGVEPAHFIMERKMLLGIKERAERLARKHADEKSRALMDHSGW